MTRDASVRTPPATAEGRSSHLAVIINVHINHRFVCNVHMTTANDLIKTIQTDILNNANTLAVS